MNHKGWPKDSHEKTTDKITKAISILEEIY